MSAIFRKIFIAFAFAAAGQVVAGHNYSDFWGATNGGTVNIVQQGRSVVVSGLLYGSDRQPTWINFGGTLDDNDRLVANVIQNVGDPPRDNWVSQWNPFVVGNATVQFTSKSRATFTLTLNGSTSTGTLRRVRIGPLGLAGEYVATSIELLENCSVRPIGLEARLGLLRVQANAAGDVVTGTFNQIDGSGGCSYNLSLVQSGSVATGDGSFNCSDGTSGDIEVEALRAFDDIITVQMIRRFRSGDTCTATTLLSGSQ